MPENIIFSNIRELLCYEQNGLFVPNVDEYLEKIMNQASFLFSYSGRNCRGFIAYYDNDLENIVGYITMVLVAPNWRGRGIGKELVRYALRMLKKSGFKICGLEVDRHNYKAISLYSSLGFDYNGRTRGTKVEMDKRL
jgi:ribosomal protein S18 acetylase RimI-like enzyme